jgi:hypothetical protein
LLDENHGIGEFKISSKEEDKYYCMKLQIVMRTWGQIPADPPQALLASEYVIVSAYT